MEKSINIRMNQLDNQKTKRKQIKVIKNSIQMNNNNAKNKNNEMHQKHFNNCHFQFKKIKFKIIKRKIEYKDNYKFFKTNLMDD